MAKIKKTAKKKTVKKSLGKKATSAIAKRRARERALLRDL